MKKNQDMLPEKVATKKLKKVEESAKQLIQISNDLAKAYHTNDTVKIDDLSLSLFNCLKEMKIGETHPLHIQLKNYTWQTNHLRILGHIADLMQKNNRMPTNNEIASASGLSEETIYKHLREFKNHELYKHESDKYILMVHRVLTTVFNLGVQGDIRACKVFLDFHKNESSTTFIKNQSNNLQINRLGSDLQNGK